MNDNKQNTTLLTVIAVATLLVAVVGATFAYFTAANANNSTSIITASGGKMTITYTNGSNQLHATASSFQPGDNVLVTKTFTIAGENTARATGVTQQADGTTIQAAQTGIAMPYTVGMVYANEFTSDADGENSAGGLYYKIYGDRSNTSNITISYASSTTETIETKEYHKAMIPTSRENRTTKAKGEGQSLYDVYGEKYLPLANGTFAAGTSGSITFTLLIVFPDNGKNQDTNKGCSFTGKIVINDMSTGREASNRVTTYGA